MTAKQMQVEFGIELDQRNEPLEIGSDDIEYWLNRSQLDLVKEKFNGNNAQQRGFEQSQQRIDDLRVLLKRDTSLTVSYDSTKQSGIQDFYVDKGVFPNDYMFLLSSKSKIQYYFPSITWIDNAGTREVDQYDDCNTERVVFNRYASSDQIYKLLEDPFNTTKPSSPLSIITEDDIFIFTDKTFIVTDIIIDYLKYPTEIDIEAGTPCELPEHVQKEIIERAVDLFLNNAINRKQRLQGSMNADRTQITQNNE